MLNLKETSLAYLQAGLSVLPANVPLKFTTLPQWKPYQLRLPTEAELVPWFNNGHTGVCIVTGAVSGNLEMIDFDLEAEAFERWRSLVATADPDALASLVIEKSQSGGRHVVYRCQGQVSGNMKLAQRRVIASSGDDVVVCGKTYKPRKDKDGNWQVILTLIETRGEGGLFLCAPSPGYELLQGDLISLPVLTPEQRELLLEAAWALNEVMPDPVPEPAQATTSGALRPGDDYNARGDVRPTLQSHGWTCVQGGENERWRRPGKTVGWSASFNGRHFYVFSTNAHPFDQEKAYSPFGVYTLLEHDGDYGRAAAALGQQGFGQSTDVVGVDISGIIGAEPVDDTDRTIAADPGALPKDLLSVPGFVNELRDFMLQTAPHPEPVLSFFGALCLQGFLAGRKVRDEQDNRTNLYVLGLAYPGCGKDHPRKVCHRVLHEVGLAGTVADGFASGEGIEDKILVNSSMLFQTDEIDTLITATSKGKDARIDMIMNVLLKMYSASNSIYSTRLKAGKKESNVIDQPSLIVYGTAVPENYYQALSSKMLTNGFFARMMVVEAGLRAPYQKRDFRDIPDSITRAAKYWTDFKPGTGNLASFHPVPICVLQTEKAAKMQEEYGHSTHEKYIKAHACNDAVTMAIWGRANEKVCRLALIYACSQNAIAPQITEEAVQWAIRLVDYTTVRMLFMASQYVSESEFHATCQRLLRVLREWKSQKGDAWMPFWMINRKLPWMQREHEEVRTTLLNQRKIEYSEEATGGTPKRLYRLIGR
jgi:hypothetical protein